MLRAFVYGNEKEIEEPSSQCGEGAPSFAWTQNEAVGQGRIPRQHLV